MDINQLFQEIIAFFMNPNLFAKTALILLLSLFLLFTLVLGRQIALLLNLVDQVTFTPVFRFIVYGLSFATLTLLLFTIFV